MERFFIFLENMRARPEHARRSFAIVIALSVTVALLVLWGFFILPRSIDLAQKRAPKSIPEFPTPTNDTTGSNNPSDPNKLWAEMQAKYGVDSPTGVPSNVIQGGKTNTGAGATTSSSVTPGVGSVSGTASSTVSIPAQ